MTGARADDYATVLTVEVDDESTYSYKLVSVEVE